MDRMQRTKLRKQRRPDGLRGREIGLYYAKKNKEQKMEEQRYGYKPLKTVVLSESHIIKIHKLLTSIARNIHSAKVLRESLFKKVFSDLITGSFQYKIKNYDVKKDGQLQANSKLDNQFYDQYQWKQKNNDQYNEMLFYREQLPCYENKMVIVEAVNKNQVVVICGETGCGKTTQIPQFILDDCIVNRKGSTCRIICTQPRRISAISVAERVAKERGESCGIQGSIGYAIRLEKKYPRDLCSITFCTTGILLKQMETDPVLSDVSHLVLDEIHERDIVSDFVMTLIKQIIPVRPDLKVILMSATLNAEKFSNYFENCPVITIPGFTYPVKSYYLEDVLLMTNYDFPAPPEYNKTGWRKHLKHVKEQQRKTQDFYQMIGPYVSNLRATKKYSRRVCDNIMNPNSEVIDYKLIVLLLKHICDSDCELGSVLIFMPGFFEISKMNQELMKNEDYFDPKKFMIINLHSKLSSKEQRKVFETKPHGMRKIVIATNIAETSITIEDVMYVIDCGKHKLSDYDYEKDLEVLGNTWITVANMNQRKGRAGRVKPGICYHLYTTPRLETFQFHPKPEIQRSRLENIILTMKMLQLQNTASFLNKFMDSPNPKAIENAVKLLKQMAALDLHECLTPLGYHLAVLPIHPRMGKMILLGALFSCLDPILSIAASLDFKDAFQFSVENQREALKRRRFFAEGWKSDHLILADVIKQYEIVRRNGNQKQFCQYYFLNEYTLELLCKMKQQFTEYLFEMKFISTKNKDDKQWNYNSANMSLIKAIVCAGLYPNVAIIRKIKKRGKIVQTLERERVQIHRNSINDLEASFESNLLVYFMKQKMQQISLYDTTMVYPLSLIFFGDRFVIEDDLYHAQQTNNFDYSIISLTDMLRFRCKTTTAELIKDLRDKLNDLLKFKVSHPGCVNWTENNAEVSLLRAIMELITTEDLGDMSDSEEEDDSI